MASCHLKRLVGAGCTLGSGLTNLHNGGVRITKIDSWSPGPDSFESSISNGRREREQKPYHHKPYTISHILANTYTYTYYSIAPIHTHAHTHQFWTHNNNFSIFMMRHIILLSMASAVFSAPCDIYGAAGTPCAAALDGALSLQWV